MTRWNALVVLALGLTSCTGSISEPNSDDTPTFTPGEAEEGDDGVSRGDNAAASSDHSSVITPAPVLDENGMVVDETSEELRRRRRDAGASATPDAGSTPTPDASTPPDAGTTPKPDAGTTPTPDAGTTPKPDAGTTTDAGTTPKPDAGTMTDAGTTPKPDAGATTDAGTPPKPDAGTTTDAGTTPKPDAGTTPPTPTSGCGSSAPFTGQSVQTINVAGTNRTYAVTIPSGYDNTKPYALIFGYHGSGGTGIGSRGDFNMEGTTQNQAIFVYPDGAGGVWSLTSSGVDVAMFDALLASMSSKFCIDQRAVFAMGFSYGGWMTNALGCYRGNKLAGFISVSGGGPSGSCPGAPTGAMIVHGSTDTAEPPIAGERSRDYWRNADTCSTSTSSVAPAPCVQYSGCSRPVLWCSHPGGHFVPGFVTTGAWGWFSSLR